MRSGTPRVYLFNIDTGQQEVLGDFPGMTFAPRFSPDGNRVIMSIAVGRRRATSIPSICARIAATQLTDTAAIDTSPCYSPDGAQIVFNSDRGGSQQLYVMNADGSNIQRISFGSGTLWHAGVVAARRSDRLHQDRRRTILYRRDAPRRLGRAPVDQGFLVEGPTWAPNGRVLMYFRQTPATDRNGRGGSPASSIPIDLTGYNEREIVTPRRRLGPGLVPLDSVINRRL